MKVLISVHGRFHAFELAAGLFQRGLLDTLLTTYPKFVVNKITKSRLPVLSAPHLELLRRMADQYPFIGNPDVFIVKRFGKFAARKVEKTNQSGILVGWSSATLEAISPAKKAGKIVIVERGSSHIKEQEKVLHKAYLELGCKGYKINPEIIDRELEEYNLADKICVPSKIAANSFLQRGFPEEKIIINPLGVDVGWFKKPRVRSKNKRPRIVFAGSVGVRKGVPWLLKAINRLSAKCDLHLFGNLERGFGSVVQRIGKDSVRMFGPVPSDRLAIEYSKADIFCLPSIEEGFGLVVLQAMAMGVPVVVTESVGAASIIDNGVNGLIVPPFDDYALKDALESLIEDKDRRHKIGDAGYRCVKNGYSWQDYVQRAIENYKKLL